MPRLSFLIYSTDPEIRERVAAQLTATERVRIAVAVEDIGSLAEALGSHRLDGAYLDLDLDPERVLGIAEALPSPPPLLLIGGRTPDSELLMRAMRLGAKDFARDHQLADLTSAFEALAPVTRSGDRVAPVLSIVGAKGGVGATTLACELAVSLQEIGHRTLVCDLSRRIGDVAMYFDLTPNYNIADMARREAGMDSVFIDSVVAEHSSHVSILAAPTQLDDFNLVNAAKLDHVLKLLRNEFDCIILDAPWDFDEFSLRAIDMSNETLIVSTPDVMSVTHARVQRESMQRLGASADRIHTLLNRVSKSQTLTRKQMEEYLGGSIEAEIPDAPMATRESADEGQILREVQGSQDILQAIAGLRAHVCDWCKLETQEGRSAKADAGFVAKFRGLIRRKPNGTA